MSIIICPSFYYYTCNSDETETVLYFSVVLTLPNFVWWRFHITACLTITSGVSFTCATSKMFQHNAFHWLWSCDVSKIQSNWVPWLTYLVITQNFYFMQLFCMSGAMFPLVYHKWGGTYRCFYLTKYFQKLPPHNEVTKLINVLPLILKWC